MSEERAASGVLPGTPRRRAPFGVDAGLVHAARDGTVGVRVVAGMLDSVVQIGTWPAGVPALCEALANALALPQLPERTGQTVRCGDGYLLRAGPEEFLLVSGGADGWDPLESTCRHASLSIL